MTPFPQLVAIDEAITSLSQGTGDPVKIAQAMTEGIKFLGSVIDQLKEERAELIEDTEELIEKIEELETDQEIILQYLQTQGIDITYIVRKEKSDDSDTSDNPN
jgi:FtsZ-binding cell division protein ZapB